MDKQGNIIAKFLAIYEGPYSTKKKQVSLGKYILLNETTETDRGMFHANDLLPCNKEKQNIREIIFPPSDESPKNIRKILFFTLLSLIIFFFFFFCYPLLTENGWTRKTNAEEYKRQQKDLGTSIDSLTFPNKVAAESDTTLNIFIGHRSHVKTFQGKPLQTGYLTKKKESSYKKNQKHEFRMIPNETKATIIREFPTTKTTSKYSRAT